MLLGYYILRAYTWTTLKHVYILDTQTASEAPSTLSTLNPSTFSWNERLVVPRNPLSGDQVCGLALHDSTTLEVFTRAISRTYCPKLFGNKPGFHPPYHHTMYSNSLLQGSACAVITIWVANLQVISLLMDVDRVLDMMPLPRCSGHHGRYRRMRSSTWPMIFFWSSSAQTCDIWALMLTLHMWLE